MANLKLLYEAFPDDGTYSGGSWSLPLTNLQDQHPKKVARSTNALITSTLFVIDLARVAPLDLFAFVNHNFSSASTVRIRASNNADGSSPLIDVTIDGLQPDVPWGSLPWGAFPWTGVSGNVPPGGYITYYQHTSVEFARYILVNITDTANSDGYVQIGRFLAGEAFSSAINMAWGAGLEFVDESKLIRSIDGDLYADVRPKRRRLSAQLQFLTEDEAIGAIYDLNETCGITGALLAIWDSDDETGVKPRRTIYGALAQMSPIVAERAGDYSYSWPMTLEELT